MADHVEAKIMSIILVGVIFFLGLFPILATKWRFLVIMGCLIGFLLYLGIIISNNRWGVLVDEAHLISLSRFQMVIWTVLILSAFLAVGGARIEVYTAVPQDAQVNDQVEIPSDETGGETVEDTTVESMEDPLAIELPEELWILLGISTTSLVGSPLILSGRDGRRRLVEREIKEKPSFTDMFKGDEEGNKDVIDMAKVQMFFFTMITYIAYSSMLWTWMATNTAAGLTRFPALSESMITILGISHAGFLTNLNTKKPEEEPDYVTCPNDKCKAEVLAKYKHCPNCGQLLKPELTSNEKKV